MAFGDKLKEIREKQNLSQLDVANALGVSDRTVSVWERNLKMPNLESAIRLSHFLNVSLDPVSYTHLHLAVSIIFHDILCFQ